MQTNWNTVLAFTLQQEGGFESDPEDPGCWTGDSPGAGVLIGSNMGIAAATLAAAYPNYDTDQLSAFMKDLPESAASSIYQSAYWQPVQGDSLPAGIDLLLFDDAVNKGVSAAVQTIQGCVGTAKDGILGPMTLEAIQSSTDLPALAVSLSSAQGLTYLRGSNWQTFGLGWSRRWAARVNAACQLLAG